MRTWGARTVDGRVVVVSIVTALAGYVFVLAPIGLSLRDDVTATLVFLMFAWVTGRPTRQASFLPLARTLVPGLGPLIACLVLISYSDIAPADALTPSVLLVSLVNVALSVLIVREKHTGGRGDKLRIAVVGAPTSAAALTAELRALRSNQYEIVGFVDPEGVTQPNDTRVRRLGTQDTLATIVSVHRIDLLLVSAEVPRLPLFDEIARSCLNLPVRVMELAGFYEETFGHVALAAINASWFQYLMHPRYSSATPGVKRAFDLAVAIAALVMTAPLIGVLAMLVRLDGGPAFYRQKRIGEGGRSFEIIKLRSMRHSDQQGPSWSVADDDRVTRVGLLMRRMHVDELPQLLNVIKGEMSIVGPRPEQPPVVKVLESMIPFYSRRHLVRPGITGWAQVQCGYAGSQHGSALKACYDLYYIKHRSVLLDCLILVETARMFVADSQWRELSRHRAFAIAEEAGGADPWFDELSRMPEPVQES